MAQSEIETLGMVKLADPTHSIEDKRALSLMEKTTFKSVNEDAYVSGLLWRDEEPSLPNNYGMAKRRAVPRSEREMQSQSRMTLRRAL